MVRDFRLHATKKSFNARHQLWEGKWFAEIVICPGTQAFNPVLDGVVRGQHHHTHIDMLSTYLLQEIKATPVRKSDVKHQKIGLLAMQEEESFLGAGGERHHVALGRDAREECVGKFAVVLNNKDSCCAVCHTQAPLPLRASSSSTSTYKSPGAFSEKCKENVRFL